MCLFLWALSLHLCSPLALKAPTPVWLFLMIQSSLLKLWMRILFSWLDPVWHLHFYTASSKLKGFRSLPLPPSSPPLFKSVFKGCLRCPQETFCQLLWGTCSFPLFLRFCEVYLPKLWKLWWNFVPADRHQRWGLPWMSKWWSILLLLLFQLWWFLAPEISSIIPPPLSKAAFFNVLYMLFFCWVLSIFLNL